MSIIQTTSDETVSRHAGCPRCGSPLPPGAVFCASCGERLGKKSDFTSLLKDAQDITTRYRITSLIRRRQHINLYFALDNRLPAGQGQQRVVAIRDIDISAAHDEQVQLQAIDLAQQEYDALRRWHIPFVMPAIDLRYYQGHLFVVTGLPALGRGEGGTSILWPRLATLQDFLQSGQGLPTEQRAVQWISALCLAVEQLHRNKVIIGDLEPHTIILNNESIEAQPALMISWYTPSLRSLLPAATSTSSALSYFIAPEAVQDEAEPRSDIYSLGAVLYLLLTGMPPDESTLRNRGRLRTPQEVQSRISLHVSECVMQALSVDPAERFQSALAFSDALKNPRYRRPQVQIRREQETPQEENVAEMETVRILPLSRKEVERWRAARPQAQPIIPPRPGASHPAPEDREAANIETQMLSGQLPDAPIVPETPPVHTPVSPVSPDQIDRSLPIDSPPMPPVPPRTASEQQPAASNGKPSAWKRITGMLPAVTADLFKRRQAQQQTPPASPAPEPAPEPNGELSSSWLGQLKHMVLGQQQSSIAAAAIVETPLRVQPDQMYTLRVHLMGRDEALPTQGAKAKHGEQATGLSGLIHGDTVLIEVRSVLQQSYAIIVQQAAVTVPARGYVAEVTIPMRPLSSTPAGRRDRLHIHFMNERHHPLYEKPFVVEIFVSQHVRRGNEGHHVLTIPV